MNDVEMNIKSRLSVPPEVMSRLVGDETVLLDLASGTYFGLGGVGKRIWEAVSAGRSLEQTVEALTTEFEVDKAQAEADVLEFAKNLIDRGLLAA